MTPDERWEDNSIQFPRLIAEILATDAITDEVFNELSESMGLDAEHIDDLFERAQAEWDRIVGALPMRPRYVIHNMHGPTVYQSDDWDEICEKLVALWGSNGGVYRIVRADGVEVARLNTNCG